MSRVYLCTEHRRDTHAKRPIYYYTPTDGLITCPSTEAPKLTQGEVWRLLQEIPESSVRITDTSTWPWQDIDAAEVLGWTKHPTDPDGDGQYDDAKSWKNRMMPGGYEP